jgi:hypothetical protein
VASDIPDLVVGVFEDFGIRVRKLPCCGFLGVPVDEQSTVPIGVQLDPERLVMEFAWLTARGLWISGTVHVPVLKTLPPQGRVRRKDDLGTGHVPVVKTLPPLGRVRRRGTPVPMPKPH